MTNPSHCKVTKWTRRRQIESRSGLKISGNTDLVPCAKRQIGFQGTTWRSFIPYKSPTAGVLLVEALTSFSPLFVGHAATQFLLMPMWRGLSCRPVFTPQGHQRLLLGFQVQRDNARGCNASLGRSRRSKDQTKSVLEFPRCAIPRGDCNA